MRTKNNQDARNGIAGWIPFRMIVVKKHHAITEAANADDHSPARFILFFATSFHGEHENALVRRSQPPVHPDTRQALP